MALFIEQEIKPEHVIPVLVTGNQPSSNCGASGEMDPGNPRDKPEGRQVPG
jgi:hypothetical protein